MKDFIKKINLKYLHLLIILFGIILVFSSVFHANIWFDESYSVGIARHSFAEIWNITSYDVHPPFYYYCLHILYLIFGSNIIIYRLFSALTIGIMGILGYTHIRKDFGEKTGLLFSFLSLFLPFAGQFAGEIRMYSLGMLLGTIMAIYAYRIYTGKTTKTTYLFFGLSSLLSVYTHYYGVMLAGIINLILFIYLLKNKSSRKNDLIKFIITAILQVVAYAPWLIIFVKKLAGVSGFWITLTFPGTLYEILTTQYKGYFVNAPIILTTLFYAYITYLVFNTKKDDRKPATLCFAIYISIIIIALIISLCLQSVILLFRYLLIVTGLLIFGLAFFMAKDSKLWRVLLICSVFLCMTFISNYKAIKENYNNNNNDVFNYINNNLEENDIILYSNAINGAVISTKVEHTSFFYDREHWNVYEAYKAFSPYMEIDEDLKNILDNYSGRIWLIESENTHDLLDEIKDNYQITELESKEFKAAYKNYTYNVELIEK